MNTPESKRTIDSIELWVESKAHSGYRSINNISTVRSSNN
jgi:hypothetical protein